MVLDIYYQQRAAIFVVVFALFGHVKDAYFVHKRKKIFSSLVARILGCSVSAQCARC